MFFTDGAKTPILIITSIQWLTNVISDTPRILLVEDEDTPSVELFVEDNGQGIQPDLIGRLFDPYVTSKTKGTGLGLSIVKKIIEEHGGIIRADNVESGARFTARLPVSSASVTSSMPQAGTS